jgi:outer membrane protein assembly factor BamB
LEHSSREPDAATCLAVIVALPLAALAAAILVAAFSQLPPAAQRPVDTQPAPGWSAAIGRESPADERPAAEPSPPELPPIKDSPRAPAQDLAPTRAELPVVRGKGVRRGLLVEAYGKEAYNALTELKAAIESEAWEDAARLVTGLDPAQAPGIAPWIDDAALAVSLPVAAQLAHEKYPQLRQALGEQFAVLAKLRLAQAVRASDAAAIELATAQFAGTPAAAEAHQWLGDQALVAGWFSRSVQQYQRARSAAPALAAEVAPRIRLAAAMLGRDAGSPATAAVPFGDVSLSPAEFEALITEMNARGASLDEPIAANDYAAAPPAPAAYETQLRGRLEGAVGDRPIATAVAGNVLYVADHFQVTAYDLKRGERLWHSEPPPGSMPRGQEWALTRMRPLIQGDRIFVRLLQSASPRLVCLEISSGKLLWVGESRERELVVSDPLLVQGQLVALGLALQPDQQGLLRLYTFDPKTGQTLRERDLVRLRSAWSEHSCCELVGHDDGLVAILGGATLDLDGAGSVRWIRQTVGLPADEDARPVRQIFLQPLLAADRMYLAQPGSQAVECLDLATGRQFWSAKLPAVACLVGLAGDKLIVRTAAGVQGLATQDGTSLWQFAAPNLMSFPLVDRNQVLLAAREPVPLQPNQRRLRLTWLNPADGQPTATTALLKLDDTDPRLGPLAPFQDRIFTFFGRGHETARELVELIPRGPVPPRSQEP